MILRLRLPFAAGLLVAMIQTLSGREGDEYKPDPLPTEAVVLSDKLKDLPIPNSFFAPEAVFADQFGPYLLVGRNGDPKEAKVLYDLKTGKALGTLKGKLNIAAPFAVAPDGKSFAGTGGPFMNTSFAVIELEKQSKVRHQLKADKKVDDLQFVSNDRLVTVSDFGTIFVLWDAVKGKEIKTSTIERFREGGYAISPGGKYLVYGKDKKIKFYDLVAGEKVDELDYPQGGTFGFRNEALAFSPDGTQLAALMTEANNPQLVIWDLTKRTVRKSVPIGQLKNVFAKEPLIQWSPDAQAIMVKSEVILDAQSGRTAWKMPEAKLGADVGARLVAANQALYIQEKDRQVRVLTSAGVTKDQLAEMVKNARSGGEASDALLPKLNESNYASAKSIHLPLGNVSWAYQADGLGNNSKLTTRPFPMQVKANEIDALHFTSPETASVFVELKPAGTSPFGPAPKSVGFESYSLATGKKLESADFKFPAKVGCVSADGKQVALIEAEKAGRVDVFTVEKMEPVAGFRPYAKEGDKKNKIVLTHFVGSKLLTISDGGKVVLWSLPSSKAEIVLDAPGLSNWKLSPTGKYLAAFDKTSIRLIDTATLQVVGDLPLPNAQAVRKETKGLAFDPTGKTLVALLQFWGSDNFQRWGAYRYDLATGKETDNVVFRANFVSAQPNYALETAGKDYLLVDNTVLVDWKQGEVIWNYRGQGFDLRHATNRPDGRHWFTVGEGFNKPESYLVPATLPEPAALAYVEKILNAKDALIKPGMSVSVEANFQGGEADRIRQNAIDNAANALKGKGMKVENRAALHLRLSGAERNTGETISFRKLFPSFGESPFSGTEVTLMEVDCQAQLTLNGQVIWSSASKQGMRTFGIITLPQGEKDVAKVLRTQMWNGVANWAGAAVPPRYIVNTNEGVLALPGTTMYKVDGLQTLAPKVGK